MSAIISITQPNENRSEAVSSIDEDGDISMVEEDNGLDLNITKQQAKQIKDIVVPGELITDDPSWMRGHGTYFLDEKTYSAVAGVILRVNKLLSVIPFKGRYNPETGDHIVGRIVDVTNKRWKVDVGAEHDAILNLGVVNLPGGVLRRKSETDELQMRTFMKEGDLLNAEVQSVLKNGSATLHTRSLKYGKLRNGVFVAVPSNLIIRSKQHAHDLPGGVSVILGVNGYCWIYKTKVHQASDSNNSGMAMKIQAGMKSLVSSDSYQPGMATGDMTKLDEEASWDIYSDKNDPISATTKKTISRYRNCLLALSHCNIAINETRLAKAYEISMGYGGIDKLVSQDIQEQIGQTLIDDEKMKGEGY